MSRRQNKRNQRELFGIRYLPEKNMQGTPPVRNRMERRMRIHGAPRQHRINIYGWGQWQRKVIKNGELTRP